MFEECRRLIDQDVMAGLRDFDQATLRDLGDEFSSGIRR
jgi:hypothetical protein